MSQKRPAAARIVAKAAALAAPKTQCAAGSLVLQWPPRMRLPQRLTVMLDRQLIGTFATVGGRLCVPLQGELLPTTFSLHDAETDAVVLAPSPLHTAIAPQIEQVLAVGGSVSLEVSLASRLLPALRIIGRTADGSIAIQGVALPPPPGDVDDTRSRYRALLPLRMLTPVGGRQVILLEVGGWRIEPAISVSSATISTLGYVEDASHEAITGWAIDLGDPLRRLKVSAVIGTRVLATVTADRPRPDLVRFGVPAANCGFSFAAHKFSKLMDGEQLSIVLTGTETNLVNSPLTINISASIRGLFDMIEGDQAQGWVIDLHDPHTPRVVEALCEGRVVGEAVASVLRRDVLEAGYPTDRCGFRISFTEPLATLLGRDIRVRVKGTTTMLVGGPQQPRLNANVATYLTPDRGMRPAALDRLRARIAQRTKGGGISLVMPVHDTPRDWLIEALRSVCTQWCDRWELICVDDASTAPQVAFVLNWFAQTEPRIRVIRSAVNLGIAGATNLGIAAARLPFVALMDHDDVLEPDAIYHLITAGQEKAVDLIYSDEAITGDVISNIRAVRARPAFSHDYYLSHPYFVHLVAVRRELAQRIGGFDETLKISADVDFVLRVIEGARAVAHVPRVLYRWRTHDRSTGHAKQSEVMAATTAAIQRHLDRRGLRAIAHSAAEFNQFEIAWPDPKRPVLIVIPTKDGVDVLRQCVTSIEATTPADAYRLVVIDHESKEPASKRYLANLAKRHVVMPYKGVFNYSQMNNLAVRAHGDGADFVLFMNNDVEAIGPGWLERMRSLAARPEVGAVGALLLYSDKRVQHGGVVVGINGLADHALRFEEAWDANGERALGYNASLTSVRDFSAVTAACMMMRTEIFEAVGGFDERFAVGFNDTDLCLRVGQAGYKILYDGRSVLYHHESVTRIAKSALKHPKDDRRLRERWSGLLRQGDPYYNPALELEGRDHRLREGLCPPARPRVVAVNAPIVTAKPKPKPKPKRLIQATRP